MIPQHWYAISVSKSIREKPVGLRRLGQDLVLWRDGGGRLVCMPDRCSHRGGALSLGGVVDGHLRCPRHGLRFDGEGRCRLVPCHGRDGAIPDGLTMTTHPVREAHGFVWLWWGKVPAELPPVPWFEDLPADLSQTATRVMEWEVSFGRTMESQMDMHHFPFLHRKVSGKTGPLMDPYGCEMEGDLIHAWGQLRRDDGRGAEESPGLAFDDYVLFPGLVLTRLTPNIRLLAANTPIDEGRTWIAARYYLERPRIPLLGKLSIEILAFCEEHLLWKDDERAVLHTLPRETGLSVNRPIAADGAILLWLRRRDQLLEERNLEEAAPERLEEAAAG